jgi:hypothetical protein
MHQKVFVLGVSYEENGGRNGVIKDWCEAIKVRNNSKCKGFLQNT